MDVDIERQIKRLHESSTKAIIVVTGGGARAIDWLLSVPGASRTILEAQVPYDSMALLRFLGYQPKPAVAMETANDMARNAYLKARRLYPDGANVVGIGCSAAIATDRPKKGVHRCFVSSWTARGATAYKVTFTKGCRDRNLEEDVVSKLILYALTKVSDVEVDLSLGLNKVEALEVIRSDKGELVDQLLRGEIGSILMLPDGSQSMAQTFLGGVLSGSFDPLHQGHMELARVAEGLLGVDVAYELSVTNVEKPSLDRLEIDRRISQFATARKVAITRAPTFDQKAKLFPGCTFIIGWDTAVRLLDPRYYGGDAYQMRIALNDIRSFDCRLLVAGRLIGGVFHTIQEVSIPAGYENMFTPIPEDLFRYDISSTQLRTVGCES